LFIYVVPHWAPKSSSSSAIPSN